MKKSNTAKDKKTQSTTKLIVISDLHIGSTLSMVPEGFVTHEGYTVGLNSVNKYLNACWQEFQGWIDRTVGNAPFALIINGDIIEGLHHGTKEVWSTEIEDQIEAASLILAPLARRAAKVYLVDGTECHTGGHEHRVGRLIGAQINPETKRCVFPRLTLECGKHTIVCKHHIGTATRSWSESSAYMNNLTEERVQAALNKLPLPDVLLAAHRHKFGHWEDAYGHCIVTPPWQMATRFARKVVPCPIVRPGAICIDTSGERVSVSHITYDPLPPKRTRL